MKVFHDGMPAWKKSGRLVLSSVGYIKQNLEKDIPTVVVDVRNTSDATKGFIPGAVSVPAEGIERAKDKFPADKKAPIVLYSADDVVSASAFAVIRGWGFSNTSVLEGGIDAWRKAGYTLESGDLKTDIVYVPKPRPGEISVDEFKKIVETHPPDTLVLDIRDVDEAMQGMLKGAVNIPTQELSKRLAEIPRDKQIVTYCQTGVRAEIAYNILKDAGYNVRFLNANLKVDKDGKYELSKE